MFIGISSQEGCRIIADKEGSYNLKEALERSQTKLQT
jgi:hypothetical protein